MGGKRRAQGSKGTFGKVRSSWGYGRGSNRMTGERRCKMFWHRTAGTFHVKRSLRGTGHGHLSWDWHWQPGQLGRWRRQVGTGFPLKKRATADSGSWRSNVKEQKTSSSYWAMGGNVSLRVLRFLHHYNCRMNSTLSRWCSQRAAAQSLGRSYWLVCPPFSLAISLCLDLKPDAL